MTEAAKKNITNLRTAEQLSQKNEPLEPWMRQKNEPALWHMRFKRYLEMGPKRSLRAVVASEPQNEKAEKGDKIQKRKSDSVALSVPGAWSRAAKTWNWKERAAAYDLFHLEKQAAYIRKVAIEHPFASKAYRLVYLCGMANALHKSAEYGLDLDENVKYAKTMQALFKDIERLMEGLDETTLMMADAAAHKHLIELANKQKAKG